MTPATQLQHFCNDLDNLIDRYASEFDLNYASIIGALQIKSHLLCQEAQNNNSDIEENDE
jgi:hypothetical protein